jgi:membrane protease YdiL (CAAX protease family)
MTNETEPSPLDSQIPEFSEPDLVWEPSDIGPEKASPAAWGPWSTVGWSLLLIAVWVVLQLAVFVVFVAMHPFQDLRTTVNELASDGNVVATATLVTTPVIIGLVALLVRLRGCRIREYLALRWPPVRSVAMAFVGLAIVLFSSDLLSYSLGRPLVPEVMVEFYRRSSLPYLLLAIVILAPLGEETLFRGFLYKGLAESRAGPFTAILVSTILFALIHVQYDWYGVALVAAIGLYLAVVRYKAGSVPLSMVLHAVANAVASVEVAVQEHWLP